jgi:hypothetical protein
MVLLSFCVLPLPLKLQLAPAVVFTVGGVLMCLLADLGEHRTAALAVATGFSLATVLGAATSWQLHRRKRDLFALARREAELRSGLEKALVEIRTLRGMLAICSYCKKIRNDAGRWEQVETYVRDRTHAVFSHGICPQCFDTVVATLPPSSSL